MDVSEAYRQMQQHRIEKAHRLLKGSSAVALNGLEIPQELPEFLGVEQDGNGEILWAYFEDSLDDIGKDFVRSETDGIFRRRVYSLDNEQVFCPVFKVQRWIEVTPLRILKCEGLFELVQTHSFGYAVRVHNQSILNPVAVVLFEASGANSRQHAEHVFDTTVEAFFRSTRRQF